MNYNNALFVKVFLSIPTDKEESMSTQFDSAEGAKEYLLALCGLDPKSASVEDVPDLHVAGFGDSLVNDPDTPGDIKESIKSRIAAQKGYQVSTPKGDVKFVIDKFRDGFCCWIVGEGGVAIRL